MAGREKVIDDAVREIDETSKALTSFEETVNGAFKDGIIEQAEAKAIEKYINTLNTEKADADAVYTKLYSNIYLLGTPKTDLLNSKITYNGAHTELIKAVNDAIADGRTTVAEKTMSIVSLLLIKMLLPIINQRWRLPIRLSRIHLKVIRTKL